MIHRVYNILIKRGIQAEVRYPATTAIVLADALREKGFQAETWGERVGITATTAVSTNNKLWTVRRTVGSLIIDHDGITFTGFRMKKKSAHAGSILDTVIETLKGLPLNTIASTPIESSTSVPSYFPAPEG